MAKLRIDALAAGLLLTLTAVLFLPVAAFVVGEDDYRTHLRGLNNLILGPILPDGKNFDLRFVIDGVKYDLPGIAKDGELLVSPHDANIELRIQEVTEALRAGKQAQIAVPAKAWKSKLPLDGAGQALDGIFEACL